MDYDYVKRNCCNDTCDWKTRCHIIEIYNTNITLDDIKYLSTVKVHILVLSDNKIGDKGVEFLARNKTLHTLDLSNNNIGDKGAEFLARNKTLHTIELNENNIGNKVAKIIRSYIQKINYNIPIIPVLRDIVLEYLKK